MIHRTTLVNCENCCDKGPYKYMDSPMYGIGYMGTYALAVYENSLFSLIVYFIMHACVLLFNKTIEQPKERVPILELTNGRERGEG